MASPLEHLYHYIVPSLARVAPERASDLQRLIDQLGVTFNFDDTSPNMVFKSDHADNSIKIGLRALERLWVRAYAYIHLYEHITKLQLADVTARDFDLTKDVNVANAMVAAMTRTFAFRSSFPPTLRKTRWHGKSAGG